MLFHSEKCIIELASCPHVKIPADLLACKEVPLLEGPVIFFDAVTTQSNIFADEHNWIWCPPLLQLSFDDILRSERDEIGIHTYILDCTQFVFFLFSLISIPAIGLLARAAIRFGQQSIFSSADSAKLKAFTKFEGDSSTVISE